MKKNDVLKNELIEFGLSANEAIVYLYLLERGTALGGSKIATGTKLHRQYVYASLPQLISLGLIDEIPHGKHHKYMARPPIEIEKITRRRAIFASDLVKNLNMISNIGNEQGFEVIQGARAIERYEMDYVARATPESVEYIIGGASRGFASLMGETLSEYLHEKLQKKLNVKYIGSANERSQYEPIAHKYPNQQYRFIDSMPDGIAHMVIRNETVSFFTFVNPPLVYVVQSPQVALHYQRFFEMLWQFASE